MGTDQPAPLYALANIEVPLWEGYLGVDPRTGAEVWQERLGPDGRQLFQTYKRGDQVDPSHFRQSDIDELSRWGSLGPNPPEPVPVPGAGTPIPDGAVHVTATDGVQTTDVAQLPTPPPPAA